MDNKWIVRKISKVIYQLTEVTTSDIFLTAPRDNAY